jgi:hypothetical protein
LGARRVSTANIRGRSRPAALNGVCALRIRSVRATNWLPGSHRVPGGCVAGDGLVEKVGRGPDRSASGARWWASDGVRVGGAHPPPER